MGIAKITELSLKSLTILTGDDDRLCKQIVKVVEGLNSHYVTRHPACRLPARAQAVRLMKIMELAVGGRKQFVWTYNRTFISVIGEIVKMGKFAAIDLGFIECHNGMINYRRSVAELEYW